jgi:hypothetical protein
VQVGGYNISTTSSSRLRDIITQAKTAAADQPHPISAGIALPAANTIPLDLG